MYATDGYAPDGGEYIEATFLPVIQIKRSPTSQWRDIQNAQPKLSVAWDYRWHTTVGPNFKYVGSNTSHPLYGPGVPGHYDDWLRLDMEAEFLTSRGDVFVVFAGLQCEV
jgi:hypothetical protein